MEGQIVPNLSNKLHKLGTLWPVPQELLQLTKRLLSLVTTLTHKR